MTVRRAESVRDLRCACSNLLARIVADGIELRCRRCRRDIVIKVPRDGQEGMALEVRLMSKEGGQP